MCVQTKGRIFELDGIAFRNNPQLFDKMTQLKEIVSCTADTNITKNANEADFSYKKIINYLFLL